MSIPSKSEEQQGVLSLYSTRALLVKLQAMLSNALRAYVDGRLGAIPHFCSPDVISKMYYGNRC